MPGLEILQMSKGHPRDGGNRVDKLVWNLRDGSDPEILFIRNTSPQIFISVNFYF